MVDTVTMARAGEARLHEYWPYLVERLGSDADLLTILGGTIEDPRVYHGPDDYGEPEDAPTVEWGRVIVKPTQTLWRLEERPYEFTPVNFLVVVECNDYRQRGYDVGVSLDAAHRRIYELLQWHVAGSALFEYMVQALPLYRYSAPQVQPQWDGDRGVWYKSAEYRTEAAPGYPRAASVEVVPDAVSLRVT